MKKIQNDVDFQVNLKKKKKADELGVSASGLF